MKFLDIGEVAKESGLPASTLRYYDEIGLIFSVGRVGLRRQFEPAVLLRLRLVAMGRAAGFSLDEIAGMFGSDGRPDLPRGELHDRADALDRRIGELTTLRDTIRHVADCPAPSHMECPSFQRLLKAAGRAGTTSGRRKKPGKRLAG